MSLVTAPTAKRKLRPRLGEEGREEGGRAGDRRGLGKREGVGYFLVILFYFFSLFPLVIHFFSQLFWISLLIRGVGLMRWLIITKS